MAGPAPVGAAVAAPVFAQLGPGMSGGGEGWGPVPDRPDAFDPLEWDEHGLPK